MPIRHVQHFRHAGEQELKHCPEAEALTPALEEDYAWYSAVHVAKLIWRSKVLIAGLHLYLSANHNPSNST